MHSCKNKFNIKFKYKNYVYIQNLTILTLNKINSKNKIDFSLETKSISQL